MSLEQFHQDEIDVILAYLEANHGDIAATAKGTGLSARKIKDLVALWEQKAQQDNDTADADDDWEDTDEEDADRLSYRQTIFLDTYLGQANGNGTEAARLAGYKGKPAVLAVTASRLLRNAKVLRALEQRLTESAMSAQEVLFRLSEQARGSLDEFGTGLADRFILDLGKAQRRGKLRLLKKLSYKDGDPVLELHSSQAALKILAQYHGLLSATRDDDLDALLERLVTEAAQKRQERAAGASATREGNG